LVIDLATLRQVQAASQSDLAAGLPKPQTISSAAAVGDRPRAPFGRMNVLLEKGNTPQNQNRFRLGVALMILLILILGAGVLATRWWRGSGLLNGGPVSNANAQISPSPSPTVSPSPSPSPSPKQVRKPEPKKTEKPSKLKSIWNKAKGIFR
jgi:hypothetical protein